MTKTIKLDQEFSFLFEQARAVATRGEVPVAASIWDAQGVRIAFATNRRHQDQDLLGHAELDVLKKGAQALKSWRLPDFHIVSLLEPCLMCSAAIIQARIKTCTFFAQDPKAGGMGGCLNLHEAPGAHHRVEVAFSPRPEYSAFLSSFFKDLRKNKTDKIKLL